MSEQPRILSVGQCHMDGPRIRRHLESTFEATVDSAESASEASDEMAARDYDLVLVNRILDATGEQGQDVVRDAVGRGVPVMLVSNFEDAQKKAVDAGAKPGFGKAALGDDAADQAIRDALAT